jgi:hypothetical protein
MVLTQEAACALVGGLNREKQMAEANQVRLKAITDFYWLGGKVIKTGEALEVTAAQSRELLACHRVVLDNEPHSAAERQIVKDESSAQGRENKRGKP